MKSAKKKMIIVSACLLGINCRYDGAKKPCKKVLNLFKKGTVIPICPEQLGELSTPRPRAEKKGNKIILQDNTDVTNTFTQGANEALKIAKMIDAKKAILKSKSPSCGSGKIYDGTFSGKLINNDGIFAKLCKKNGISVLSEKEI